MFFKLSSLARASVIALAALGSLPAEAASLGPVGQPFVADSPGKLIPVAQGEGRDCGPGYSCNLRNPRVRNQDEDAGEWKDRDRRRDDTGWDDDDDDNGWNGDRPRRRHHHHGYDNDFEFGIGIGVDDGYDYDDGYYDEPIYRPRYKRVYRGDGSAHVEWCYNRYRSYRAWDNSWQPNYGPRRQCRSPYS
jgi:hypothetical protein